jgi:orotate phosphoribosyltransferase-like protein
MTPRKPSLQDQIDALTARIEAGEKMRNETHQMVADMHRALMEPQLGQGSKSLVERMAEVTVDIESGKRTADNVIGIAKSLVAVAAFIAALAAFLKFGQIPRE